MLDAPSEQVQNLDRRTTRKPVLLHDSPDVPDRQGRNHVERDTAERWREYAIWWQHWMSKQSLSMGELLEWQQFFEAGVERFPELADEFRENGII